MKRIFVSLLLFTIISALSFADNANKLVILHTNDTHSQIDPDLDGKGGIIRRKVVIDSVRKADKNTLLIDAGDVVQGTLYFSRYNGAVEFPVLNMLGYDIAILGNHEFDNGMNELAKYYKNVKAELLCANYDLSKTPLSKLFKPYTIKKFGGKKIAFIAVNCDPKGLIIDRNWAGIVYYDPYTIADYIAGNLKATGKADFVVVVSHIGYSEPLGFKSDEGMANASHNIDVIIGGHSHTAVDANDPKGKQAVFNNADGKPVLVAQAGKGGKFLGQIDIDLDNLTAKSKLYSIDKRYDGRADAKLTAFIAPYKHVVDSIMAVPICKCALEMERKTIPMNNFVGDAALAIVEKLYGQKLDCGFYNSGGVRTTMPAGDVTEGLVKSMFPFENFFQVVRIKGSDFREAMRVACLGKGGCIDSSFSVVCDGDKLVSCTKNGVEIDPEKIYLVGTIDYVSGGGDYMETFRNGEVLFADQETSGTRILEYLRGLGEQGIVLNPSTEPRFINK